MKPKNNSMREMFSCWARRCCSGVRFGRGPAGALPPPAFFKKKQMRQCEYYHCNVEFVLMCVYMCVHMHVHVRVRVRMHVRVRVHVRVRNIHACTCVFLTFACNHPK